MNRWSQERLQEEFDRQAQCLVHKGYHELAGLSVAEFMAHVEPLKELVRDFAGPEPDVENRHIPFVIVVKSELVSPEQAMPLVEINNAPGAVGMYPVDTGSFKPFEGLDVPTVPVYLLLNVDTGQQTLNVTPNDALIAIQSEDRSPLTIVEGVALVTHFPEVLTDKRRYNCFSMLGSRRGDKRVPAMWISHGRPRLGWCWAGNPHTWLGSASCGGRAGA
ncbi:MAG: DUF5701 family protein [Dehalococcoidia bacterium]